MILLLALLAETAAAEPPHNYLKGAEARAGCAKAASSSDEIVVCGREGADEAYRVRPLDDDRFVEQPLRAETRIFGNGTLKLHTDPGLFGSKRAMVTLTLPF